MVLVIDNYDSFTYNLVQYLGELGADVRVRRNDQVTIDEIRAMQHGDGDSFLENSRVSKIENGQVPCMHVEEGTIAMCAFGTRRPASGDPRHSAMARRARVGPGHQTEAA